MSDLGFTVSLYLDKKSPRRCTKVLSQSPAVALFGPRQVGKTTLARVLTNEINGTLYLDLERSTDLRKLEDPRAFLQAQAGHLTIIGEVHRAPNLFAELRGIIDERRQAGERAGHFLLLGSASLDLVQQASESLAGRITYLDIGPITVMEASPAGISTDALWLRGGFPDSLTAANDEQSYNWRQNFIRSYLERDVPMFAPRMPSTTIGRLWAMLANGQGTLLNNARLLPELEVSGMAPRHSWVMSSVMFRSRNRRPFAIWSFTRSSDHLAFGLAPIRMGARTPTARLRPFHRRTPSPSSRYSR